MKKNQFRAFLIFLIVLILFNVFAFVIPFPHKAVFWIAWAFTNIAILAQAGFFAIAFRNDGDVKSKFYGVPIARVGLTYLIIQLIAGFAAMGLGFLGDLPTWPFLLVFLVIFAVAAIGLIATDAARDEIERQDVKLKKDVSMLRGLQSLGSSLVAQCDDAEVSQELKKLSEQLRFSDPVSNDATADIERELSSVMDELQRAVMEGDYAGASDLAKRAQTVLAERNRICKLNK